MKKQFVTHLALLLTLNFIVKVAWIFGIDLAVQNRVGAATYGAYYALFNLSLVFNMLLDLGITHFNNRNIAQNHELVDRHFPRIVSAKILLAGIYFTGVLALAGIMAYEEVQLQLLGWLLVNQVLSSFILYVRSNVSGLQRFGADSILSALDKALMVVIVGFLLYGGIQGYHITIEDFVWAQTMSYIITALAALVVLLRRRSMHWTFSIEWSFLKQLIKQSFPYALLILVMSSYTRIDGVMIERMLEDGAFQCGIYAQAYRLLDAVSMVAYLFAGLLLPMFAKMIKEKQEIASLCALATRFLVGFAVIIGTACWFYRIPVMDFLYVEFTPSVGPLFGTLMACFIPLASNYIFGTLLTAGGHLKALNQIAIAGLMANIGLNALLIPQYGALGAAWASLATQLGVAIAQFILAWKLFQLKHLPQTLLHLGGFLALVVACFAAMRWQIDAWYWGALVGLAITSLLAVLLKIISVREIVNIVLDRKE